MPLFSVTFIIALAASVATQMWLARRHINHISRHQAAVPQEFADQLSVTEHQKAANYSKDKTRAGMISTVLDALALLVLTLGGGLETLQNFWMTQFDSPLLVGAALILSTFLLLSAVNLPLTLYRIFGIDARYGFNNMTPALFITDLGKKILLALLLGLPLLIGVLWIMDRMGAYWWFYVWLVWSGFNLLVLALYPTLIAPLFNKFTPLSDPTLKAKIEKLLEKCGFRVQGLFVVDGSKRSSHSNAYFTGFGKSKRIVFFDTLLQRLDADEIVAVLAHELGHFKRRHIVKRIVWLFLVSFIGLALLGWLINEPWFYSGLGVDTPSTAMALLLFLLVAPVFTFLLQPLASLYSRKHEFEADQYAASQASATKLIAALVKLYKDNASTLTPDPLHSAFYDSHPPASLRIAHLKNLVNG